MLRKVSNYVIPAVFVMSISACQSESPPVGMCEGLTSLSLPNTTITLVEDVAEGEFSPTGNEGGDAFQDLPAFCRVAATLTPSSDSDIRIEVWLPSAGWNGDFQPSGNGGWGGSINFGRMSALLQDGFATAGTDTGHEGFTAAFMVGHPEKLTDFGYRAFHETIVTAKEMITAYYGNGPTLSVMNQAGGAGRQAVSMAQRYPADLDAIAVPGTLDLQKTRYHFAQMSVYQASHKNSSSPIPAEKLAVLHQAALDHCDALVDGAVDGLIEDPPSCDFDPGVVQCDRVDGADCLTSAQVETARTIYSPVVDPRTNEIITTSLLPGSELGWESEADSEPLVNAVEFFKWVVLEDPDWDYTARPVNFDADFDVANRSEMTSVLNATETDLSGFVGRGGKLLIVGGWADSSTTASGSVEYYEAVVADMGEQVRDSIRLFMVPGMGHIMSPRGAEGFDFDTLGVLLEWKDSGIAPDQIVLTRYNDGMEVGTRLVCAYPAVAVYGDSGSVHEAANFSCRMPGG